MIRLGSTYFDDLRAALVAAGIPDATVDSLGDGRCAVAWGGGLEVEFRFDSLGRLVLEAGSMEAALDVDGGAADAVRRLSWALDAAGRAGVDADAMPVFDRRGVVGMLDAIRAMTLAEVGEALARVNRYAGRTMYPYSVAQHCLALAHGLRGEARAAALLHDVAEIVTGDITHPVKVAICPPGSRAAADLAALEAAVEAAVFERLGVEVRFALVATRDRRITWDEAEHVIGAPARPGRALGLPAHLFAPMAAPDVARAWTAAVEAVMASLRCLPHLTPVPRA